MKKRTAHKSKMEYENHWDEILTFLKKDMVDSNKSLNEILVNFLRLKASNSFKKKNFYDLHKVLEIPIKRNQAPDKCLVVQNNKYAIVPPDTILGYNFIDILARLIHKKENRIDYVVELGSGVGINLFLLADKLDTALRKRITFFSCEFTDSGKKACDELLRFSHDLKMSVEHFDYYQPNFSFLPSKKNVLFFTAHSIEQIPIIDRAVFEEMIARSAQCHCYHAEPVGWQYDEELMSQRKHLKWNHWKRNRSKLRRKLQKIDRWIFSRFGIGIMDTSHKYGIRIEKTDIGKPDKVSFNAAMYSFAKDYNANLVSILKKMEDDGLIRIDMRKVNLYGSNPFNPASIISWHKVT